VLTNNGRSYYFSITESLEAKTFHNQNIKEGEQYA
jgi:hypothetical protein